MENATLTEKQLSSSRAFKNFLTRQFPRDVITHKPGYFYYAGFIRRGEKVVYYNSGDLRGGNDRLMVRQAKDEKDFTGGCNIFPALRDLTGVINRLLI